MDGEGIKVIRKRLRKTQAEMAGELEVSRQSYIAWEKDTYKIPTSKLEKLLAMDKSIPDGGLAPKETDKQRLARESHERAEARHWLTVYRATRAFYKNHNETIALFNSQGHVFPPAAQKLILDEFPDILSDPGGNHPMNKSQVESALNPPKTGN
jgi:DNA-binding XRE family transcriptional regulator